MERRRNDEDEGVGGREKQKSTRKRGVENSAVKEREDVRQGQITMKKK